MPCGDQFLNGRFATPDSQLAQASAEPPAAVESCVHHLIEKRCEEQPESPAVCAWNGNFTYQQLGILARSFGTVLAAHGVGPEVFVPVYFEKSRWTIVAMLGVLHAGGAFLLLDPSHPVQRLEWMCQAVNAHVVVASSQNASKAARLAQKVVVVDDEKHPDVIQGPPATPRHPMLTNAAYVMFTSGSTGTPKGAVIEHQSISTSTVAHGPTVNLTRATRALQFASYAFDACLEETLTVLVNGGCVCVPSEAERRSDLVGAINRLRVNWASITPSMARSLDPETLPSLQTVVLMGEAMTKDDIKQWTSHVRLFNAYGPAECSIAACTHAFPETPETTIKIGLPVGGSCWIVDENDPEKICAIGQTGELLIEGPIVGRGYIGDPGKTAAAFIDRPKWLQRKWPDAHGKVYKTGDLARCYPDGTIECLGRKDNQLKVHGQRMEAAEIEHHMRQHLPNMDLAVEVIKPKDDPESPILAAFVIPEPRAGSDAQAINLEADLGISNEEFRVLVQEVRAKLRQALPSYMVPEAFLTLPYMPLSISGKLDRQTLRQLGNSRTRRELQKLGCDATVTVPPRRPIEQLIQQLWAEVLHLPSESIGVKDSFWALGGSSIRAMKLAGIARRRGLALKVEDVWGVGTLEQMAARASLYNESTEEVSAFALCENQSKVMELMATMNQFQIKDDDVEDIYPCTRLQEGLFSLGAKRKGGYTVAMEFELPLDIDLSRFRRAWQVTLEANPILRTRIVPGPAGGLWQAVIRDSIPWDIRNPCDQIPIEWKDWQLGQRLIRLALSNTRSPDTPPLFTFVLHHALTDDWAVQLVLQQVETAYGGGILTHRQFSPFIRYLTSGDQLETDRHWREYFADLSADIFPKLPLPDYIPTPTRTTTSSLHINRDTGIGHIALAAQLKLAWGILLSHHTARWDVVFGATVAGRGAPVKGIETMTGPTIATIPTRILLDPEATVVDTLKSIQTDALRTMAVEQAGLQRISLLGAESAAACQFQSLLVVQPDESENEYLPLFSKRRDISLQTDFSSYGITVIVKPSSTLVNLSITYDPLMVTDVQMMRLINQFKHIYQQIQQTLNARLEEISSISPSDMAELRKWNGQAPKQAEQCAHELIYQRALAQPGALAVSACDGEFSYQELEMHAAGLAKRLAALAAGPETFVPVYFEKSRWTTVAMLGVLKAGGAFVLLDPSHPIDRLRNICRQAQSPVVVCSEGKVQIATQLGPSLIAILGPNHTEMVDNRDNMEPCQTSPENAMYAVFTSGSTGNPKGAVMTHGNWCTSAQANYPRMHLSTESRVLQFSAYAFEVSIADNILTLVAGGCVCVPSEQDLMSNLTGAIAALKANWAAITPPIARLLSPQTSPTLKHLILCGEPMTPADVRQWSSYLHLINLYGPAECAMLATLQDTVVDPKNIGTIKGGVAWVVDPRDSGRLSPIGAVGELLVEGPIIAREYLNEPQKTAEVFIENPPWLQMFRGGATRLYKTGDLVQYTAEGELTIVGRKDTQRKENSKSFWRCQFKNLKAGVFPPLPSGTYEPKPDHAIHRQLLTPPNLQTGVTLRTAIQLAWALVMSFYTDSNDVVFGLTLSGRNALVPGIDQFTGPTMAAVPLRTKLQLDRSIGQTMLDINAQLTAMMPHEQMGLHEIRAIGDDAARACEFQSQLVIQPPGIGRSGRLAREVQEGWNDYGDFARYGIVMACNQAAGKQQPLEVVAQYDPNMLDPAQAHRIVVQFEHVLLQILTHPHMPVRSISPVSGEDWRQLKRWNATLPTGSEQCLHELVFNHSYLRPDAPAISSWDGELTFRELHDLSQSFALFLKSKGLQPKSMVPLCMERSKWSVVSMLSVLRCGGTLVCVDPTVPAKRLENILDQVEPQLVVASRETEHKFEGCSATVVTAPAGTQIPNNEPVSTPDSLVDPSTPAFIVFTSGTTGRPKGIVMEHRTMSTGIRVHSGPFNISKNSRVLHFASYAFDASLYEVFTTLATGGCLCIPSESDRMNALERFIQDKQVDVAILAPSVLSMLDPGQVPSLKAVTVGGEALNRHVASRWAAQLTLVNGYGPAETTICCAAGRVDADWKSGTVGPMLGCVAWVTVPSDPQRLVPLGAVGELLIEGPIVTSGYLHSPELTKAGFIDAPGWLNKWRDGKPGRVYRSGDLVQLNDEGAIRFIGRKDTQVKLRGQRIELAEVEYHVRRCTGGQDVVVDIAAIDGTSVLFACLVHGSPREMNKGDQLWLPATHDFRVVIQVAEAMLREAVPAYMIPTVFLPVAKAPRTAGGKIDRRRLRHAVAELSPADMQAYTAGQRRETRPPSNAQEVVIRATWARVLNKNPETIGVDDSFFHRGGDSISAMRMVSQLRSVGINTTVQSIFKQGTIAKLAPTVTDSSNMQSYLMAGVASDVSCELSPVQRLFLDRNLTETDHFNHGFMFELQRTISSNDVKEAIRWIVQSHCMLRARFSRDSGGKWHQTISTDVDASYQYNKHQETSYTEAETIFKRQQKALHIENGPLLAVDLMYTSTGKQWLSLIVHRLVADRKSSQIILEQLEQRLISPHVSPKTSISYPTWYRLLEEQTTWNAETKSPAYPHSTMDYWGLTDASNVYADADEYTIALDKEKTKVLLDQANKTFQTRPGELIQAALIFAFAKTFPDRDIPVFFTEDHGRDAWAEGVDVSATIGLLSTIYPCHVQIDDNDSLVDVVCRTKDTQRDAQSHQWYFQAAEQNQQTEMEILCHYLDPSEQIHKPDRLLRRANMQTSSLVTTGSKVGRLAPIEIHAEVIDSRLLVTFTYSRSMKKVPAMIDWADRSLKSLSSLAFQLPALPHMFTRSDFPLLHLTDTHFEHFRIHTADPFARAGLAVLDAYPCSPIQQGMLLSQAKNTHDYVNRMVWTVQNRHGNSVDCDRLVRAWKKVVQKHDVLRTVFIDSPRGDGKTDQVVLESVPLDIVRLVSTKSEDPLRELYRHQSSIVPLSSPPHRMTVCQSATGTVACSWEVHHALVDELTCGVILRNLQNAYDDALDPSPDNVYREYISHLQRQSPALCRAYWDQYTENLHPCFFPRLGVDEHHDSDPQPGHLTRTLACVSALQGFCQLHELTLATVFQVAWGLVLRAYAQSNDVCYGYMTSGRDTPIRGIEDAAGPFINLLVRRVDFLEDPSAISSLCKSQEDFMRCLPYQYWPLAEITHRHQGPLFNSILSVHNVRTSSSAPDSSLRFQQQDGDNASEYDLVLHIATGRDQVGVLLDYNKKTLADSHATFVVDAFEQAVQGIINHSEQRLRSVPLLGGDSARTVREWNREAPEAIERCVGDMILESSLRNPDSPAICAWDGSFTYSELVSISTQLGNRLREHYDVGPEVFVPIYAIKSRWVAVAITAVIRAGGAFVLLDPTHPLERLRAICTQINASLVLARVEDEEVAASLVSRVVTLADGTLNLGGKDEAKSRTDTAIHPAPQNALYIVFTSGSTGQPKGVVIEHRSFATSAVTQASVLGIGPHSRVLQFSSFAFDASVGEILTTLIQGGCLCIPSEEQRQQDLARAVYQLQANWAGLTPSVARTMRPADFPTLRDLALFGEPLSSKDVQTWSPIMNLTLVYGPAECSVWCFGTRHKVHPGTDERSLGRGFGCRAWIVDQENPTLLVPLGATGELVIEGPVVGRGYLNNPTTTQAVFLDDPQKWDNVQAGRAYRTGDLVRYNADGTLQFIARKDLQVKLRGQRFELAEVEHHLRLVLDDSNEIIAEVATTCNGTKLLVAFVHAPSLPQEESDNGRLVGEVTTTFRKATETAEAELRTKLPDFMIPTLFLPLQRVPITNNGKLDRRQLSQAVTALSLDDLQAYSAPVTARTKPSTPVERQLQGIWSQILHRPAETIGAEDNFFRLGGDSLRAMALIPRARKGGYIITMADVFNNPRLRELAQAALPIAHTTETAPLEPFALIKDSLGLVDIAAKESGVLPHEIEDIYPCTPLQEGLIALSTKSTDRYKATFRFRLNREVDLDLFQSSWTAIAAVNPILRTRMIQSDHHPGTFQVVLFDSPEFREFDNHREYQKYIRSFHMGLGQQLADFSLVWSRNAETVLFCLTLHHSIYDGETLSSLWSQIQAYYRHPQLSLPDRPFNRFIEYVQHQFEEAGEYWRREFSSLSAPVWPALPSTRYTPVANASLHHTITGLDRAGGSEYTTTTLIHLAWALTMSCHTDSDDLVYGVTLNGRSAPVHGIEEMTGPTITTFPLRVRLAFDTDTVEDALSAIQRQGAERIPFQQLGLQNIRNTSDEAGQACQFQSHLGIQAVQPSTQIAGDLIQGLEDDHVDYAEAAEYAFVIVCHLDDTDTSSIQVIVNYDPQIVSSIAARRVLGQFGHLVQELPGRLQTPLNQLDLIGSEDRHQLSRWNSKLPSPSEVCLHELVMSHAVATPNAPAICAWDGDLTYAQLISVSGKLAGQLRLLGVQQGSLVPLCFQKSKWALTTMMAVLRAGGACVLLDPSHPSDHKKTVVRRADAKIVLTSPETCHLIPEDCGVKVITIPLQGLAAHAAADSWPAPSCHDIAFVIFTSGSTGEPKGILMEHVNLCTSIRDHSPPMLIRKATRALHFASYAFDASIYEVFTMLANGACVCIPSESDRLSNLAGFICEAHVNYAIFTPSILNRLLRPETVPGLKTVCFGGEGVTQDVVDTWSPHVDLINGYGPAEATICAVGPIDPGSWTVGTIGPVTGGLGWVTMPSDVSRLAPVGAVGELVIEGPVVTRGYLNDADRTTASYISPPLWLTQFRAGQETGRLYRTGDLVQYTDNGGIRFLGRKDTQIKLRGQRVELSHVEHHVRLCFTEATEIVAEIVSRKGNPTLVAFIAQRVSKGHEGADSHVAAEDNGNTLFLQPSTSFRAQVQSAIVRLKTSLPSYMVPAVFLHLAQVPRTTSGKLDRRRLREQATGLSNDQILAFSTHSGESSATFYPPQTARERLFQQVWGAVLGIPADGIGARDDFFELGGDSIMAMKLTSHLRHQGLHLNVSDVFAWPLLGEQASGAKECTDATNLEPYHPGSLLDIKDFTAFTVRQLECSPSTSASRSFNGLEIEDILPVTEFQRRFLAHHQLYYFRLHLPMQIDPVRLEKACQAMVERHPMLRSTFVPYRDSYLQIQFRHLDVQLTRISCEEDLASNIERLCKDDAAKGVAWGTPYLQTSLVLRSPSDSVLLLRASHAQFDRESFPLVIQDIVAAYEGASLDKAPPSFGLYLQDRQSHANSQTYRFWEQYLQGAEMTPLVLSGSDSDEYLTRRQYISLPMPPRGITLSSLVKAAWAIVLAQVTGRRDLVFGHVLNGRDTPIAGVHAISGPCVTVSPIRITIPSSQQVLDLLRHVQAQYTRALPYAGIDFKVIRQHSTPWPANTSFSCFQTHQNGAYTPSFKVQGHDCEFDWRIIGGAPEFHIVTLPQPDQLIVHLGISSRLGSQADIEKLSDRFCAAIQDLDRGLFPSLSA